MLQVHMPAWLVRSDWYGSEVDRPEDSTDSREQRRGVTTCQLEQDLGSLTADPVSPKCMNVRGGEESVGFDLTWKPDQSVAFVSLGERADQCCLSALQPDGVREGELTMSGTAVIVNLLSACPFRLSTCSFSSHQLHVS